MNRRLVTALLVVSAAVAVAGALLIWRFGWVWALLAAPLVILLMGLLVQAGGILSRGERLDK